MPLEKFSGYATFTILQEARTMDNMNVQHKPDEASHEAACKKGREATRFHQEADRRQFWRLQWIFVQTTSCFNLQHPLPKFVKTSTENWSWRRNNWLRRIQCCTRKSLLCNNASPRPTSGWVQRNQLNWQLDVGGKNAEGTSSTMSRASAKRRPSYYIICAKNNLNRIVFFFN